jgi:hypothetical protein
MLLWSGNTASVAEILLDFLSDITRQLIDNVYKINVKKWTFINPTSAYASMMWIRTPYCMA